MTSGNNDRKKNDDDDDDDDDNDDDNNNGVNLTLHLTLSECLAPRIRDERQ